MRSSSWPLMAAGDGPVHRRSMLTLFWQSVAAVSGGRAWPRRPQPATAPRAGAAASAAWRPAAAPRPAGFVGDDTCAALPRRQGKTLAGIASRQGAERAHAGGDSEPGLRDVSRPGPGARRVGRQDQDSCVHGDGPARCVGGVSHLPQPDPLTPLWTGSMHDVRNLSLRHVPLCPQPEVGARAAQDGTVTETCVACHKTEVAKLQRFGHMPVREGKMECSSCHNPHGSTNVRLLKTGNWINESCVSCHTEKRGPVSLGSRAGSRSVQHLSRSARVEPGADARRETADALPALPHRHAPSSTIYDGAQLAAKSNRLIGRSCVNCHTQIHGSNSPAGNTFLR